MNIKVTVNVTDYHNQHLGTVEVTGETPSEVNKALNEIEFLRQPVLPLAPGLQYWQIKEDKK